jgi:methyl coenzyme M reductase subunit D
MVDLYQFGQRAFKTLGGVAVENNDTKVSVTLGYTLNLGNFQSLRVDLAVTDSARNEENVKQAMDRVYGFVESELVAKVKEAKESLEME